MLKFKVRRPVSLEGFRKLMTYHAVLLQAMKEDPPPDARCRDKFLVQSVAITAEREMSNVTAIWQNVEKTSKWAIQERKIRVLFLPADGSAATPRHNSVNGTVRLAQLKAGKDDSDWFPQSTYTKKRRQLMARRPNLSHHLRLTPPRLRIALSMLPERFLRQKIAP